MWLHAITWTVCKCTMATIYTFIVWYSIQIWVTVKKIYCTSFTFQIILASFRYSARGIGEGHYPGTIDWTWVGRTAWTGARKFRLNMRWGIASRGVKELQTEYVRWTFRGTEGELSGKRTPEVGVQGHYMKWSSLAAGTVKNPEVGVELYIAIHEGKPGEII